MSDWFPKQTMGDLPSRAASLWPERCGLVYEDRRWTFSQLSDEVDRAARALMAAGVQPGEKVALWMTNRPEWIVLMYAIARVGATLVPLNTRYRSNDVGYTIQQSDTATLISMDRSGPVDYFSMLQEIMPSLAEQDARDLKLPDFPELKRFVLFSDDAGRKEAGTLGWGDLLEGASQVDPDALAERAASVDPDSTLVIAYTSGTTGSPKGVMHNHIAIRNVMDAVNRMGVTHEDVILNYLPMFHLYAFSVCAMQSIISGAKQVLMDAFDTQRVLDLVERERGTLLHGFDTHFRDLMEAQKTRQADLSSLRLGSFPAGSDASRPIAERTQSELCPTISGWGMTEVWSFGTLSFPGSTEEQRIGASGFPSLGYTFKIIDPDTGASQPADTPGEILISGYMVTQGYYKKPEATAETIKDGWLYTGDTGLLREDGHLQFIGRFKDMLKVGGENVSPAEVEGFLYQHPRVAQIAVIGVPDDRLVEVAAAFVVAAEGAPPTLEELTAHCKGKIASFKIPRHLFIVDALPETPTGKVQKHKLRDQARTLLGN